MIDAVLEGNLDEVEYTTDPFFGFAIPQQCHGVPEEILIPRNTWENKESYDKKAKNLSEEFEVKLDQYKHFI